MSTLTVGSGQTYSSIEAAVSASQSGDTIDVQAGTYTNDFSSISHDLTLQAVGGAADLVATTEPPNGKAIIDEGGSDVSVTINGFDLSGAAVSSGNGAGIRYEGGTLTLNDDVVSGNQDGLLGADDPNGVITVNNSEFADNGTGTGSTHNVYIGHIASFTFNDSYSHDADAGHEIKSRAAVNVISNSRIQDQAGTASYTVDLPNGGADTLSNDVIEQGPNSENPAIIAFGEEGSVTSNSNLTISNSTILNDLQTRDPAILNDTSTTVTVSGTDLYGQSTSQLAGGSNPSGFVLSNNTVLSDEPALNTSLPQQVSASPSTPTEGGGPSTVSGGNGDPSSTPMGGSGVSTVSGGSGDTASTPTGGSGVSTVSGGSGNPSSTPTGGRVVDVAGTVSSLTSTLSGLQAFDQAVLGAVASYTSGMPSGNDTVGATPTPPTNLPTPVSFTGSASGSVQLSAATPSVDLTGNAPVTVQGGTVPVQYVDAEHGGLFFQASGGSGVVVAGSTDDSAGGDTVLLPLVGGGSYQVTTGAADDSINAGGGNNIIQAGGGTNAVTLGGGSNVVDTTGTDIVFGGEGTATIDAATGSALVYGNAGALTYQGGADQSYIVGGTGNLTLTGGGQGSVLLAYGGSGQLSFSGGAGAATIVGGSGATTLTGEAGGGTLFAGTSGNSQLTATAADTSLVGVAGGDQLVAASSGGDFLAAGAGNETLNGAASQGGNVMFGGSGADLIQTGQGADSVVTGAGVDTVSLGAGNAAVFIGGGGAVDLLAVGGQTGGGSSVFGYRPGTDSVTLSGYSGTTSTSSAGGNTVVSLNDGASITFVGVSSLS